MQVGDLVKYIGDFGVEVLGIITKPPRKYALHEDIGNLQYYVVCPATGIEGWRNADKLEVLNESG